MDIEQPDLSEKIDKHHSAFGIASLVSGLLAFPLLLLNFGLAYFIIDPQGENSLLGGLLFGNGLLILTGIISGIIGLIQKNRKKSLAVLGLILCIMTIIFFCLVYVGASIYMVILGLSGV